MPNLAKKIEKLPPELRAQAEGYVDALLDEERYRRWVRGKIEHGLADLEARKGIENDEVFRRLEARFGPKASRKAATR
jgi:hypothetical protein